MALVGIILLTLVTGSLLLMVTGPVIGGMVISAIVIGCLFRGLYLISDIHSMLLASGMKKDRVQKVVEEYKRKRITLEDE